MTEPSFPNGAWVNYYLDQIHVVPNEDLVEHELTYRCWCNPLVTDGCVVHNSADGREAYEQHHWSNYRPKPRMN